MYVLYLQCSSLCMYCEKMLHVTLCHFSYTHYKFSITQKVIKKCGTPVLFNNIQY
jgi:hypothetical protein